jgi:hypothetical protein
MIGELVSWWAGVTCVTMLGLCIRKCVMKLD